jgi:hypothetical protein
MQGSGRIRFPEIDTRHILNTFSVNDLQTILSNILRMDERVVHNATVQETLVELLETVATPRRLRKPPPRIKVSRVGQQHIVKRKEEMRQQSTGAR